MLVQFNNKFFNRYLPLALSVFLIFFALAVYFRFNPFTVFNEAINRLFFGNSYNIAFAESLPGTGKMEIEMLKDRPEVRLKKWNGEVDMGVSYEKVQAKAEKQNDSGKVEWKGGKEEVHAYPKDGGNFEIEVKLNEKPATNKFDFTIDGAENLDFFYQPPLNEEYPNRGCSATECVYKNHTTSRPENVIGSYAVYHKTKKDHILGQTNYGTGKAFHIYRPKAIDAIGREQWALLNYKDGTLSVTVPQEFLDNAAYPVIVDPTFGYASPGASIDGGNDTTQFYLQLNDLSPAGSNTMTNISVYDNNGDVGSTVKFSLYSESADAPNARQTVDAAAWAIANGWNTNPVAFSYALSAGTQYWAGVEVVTGGATMHWDTGGSKDVEYETGNSPVTASSAGEIATNAKPSVYITYTEAAAVKIRGGGGGGVSEITQVGSVLNYNISNANSGTVATDITVPADAEIAVVGISGYMNNGGVNYPFSDGAMTFTKGGGQTAMTAVQPSTRGDAQSAFMAAMFYQVLPDTGSNKTLTWDWVGTGTTDNPPIISITFWKGINTSNPVRGSGGGQNGFLPYTSSSITAQSGDKIVAWVGAYFNGSGGAGTIDSWSNLNLLSHISNYGNSDGTWATGSPSGNTTVAASTGTAIDDGGIVAISLIPASASSGNPSVKIRGGGEGGPQTPAFVQACNNIAYSGNTVTCTFSPTAGNVLAVWAIGASATPITMSDTCNTGGASDTYSTVDNPTSMLSGGMVTTGGYAVVGKTGSCTVTATFGTADVHAIVIHEVSGINTSSPLDAHNVNAGGYGASSTVTTTTNTDGDYIFAAVVNTDSGVNYTAGVGYVIPANGTAYSGMATEYAIQSSHGLTTATFTGTGNYVNTQIMAFKPASGGVGGVKFR